MFTTPGVSPRECSTSNAAERVDSALVLCCRLGLGLWYKSRLRRTCLPYSSCYQALGLLVNRGCPYLSIHVPGNLAPTLEAEKPFFSKTEVYHGFKPADRRSTLPPIFIARFSAWTWVWAWSSPGSNQSMLSMTCMKSQCLSWDFSLTVDALLQRDSICRVRVVI